MKRLLEKRPDYAWLVLAICCLSQGAVIGIETNCLGLFYSPVSSEFGCGTADIALSVTITSIVSFITTITLARKVVLRFPVKYVMFGAAFLVSLRMFLAFSGSVWQWWAVSALSGIGLCMMKGFAVAIILERWFKKKLSIAFSAVAVFSGLIGIAMSLLIGVLIRNMGWRPALFIAYLTLLVLNLPTLILALNPKDKGMIPYGAENDEQIKEEGSTSSRTKSIKTHIPFDKRLVFSFALCFVNASATGFISHLSSFGTSIGTTLFNVSLYVTAYTAGNMVFKIAYGKAAYSAGLRKSSIAAMSILVVSFMMMFTRQQVFTLFGAFLFGSCALIHTTMVPLVEHEFYDSDQYSAMIQRCFALYDIVFALIGYLYGVIKDSTGSYDSVIIYMMLISIGVTVMFALVLPKQNKQA